MSLPGLRRRSRWSWQTPDRAPGRVSAEPAQGRGDARERPWRATSGAAHFGLDPATPAGAAATAAVADAYFDRSRVIAEDFIATWQDVAALRNVDLWLSVDEVAEVAAALAAAVDRYRDRTLRNRPRTPAGSES